MTTDSKRKATIVELKALLEDDEDWLRVVLQDLLQEVLEQEMTKALAAAPGERTRDRVGYRAGHYPRSLVTRVGKLELRVPRDRDGRFSTELFARHQRSDRALVSALAEMYIQGVSTRKVKAITEELCGHSVSASTISRINKRLDKTLTAFAERELDEPMPYLILDARYEKVRENGVIRSQAVLIGIGIGWDGRRHILGVELANRESRGSWKAFLAGLRERGLHGVEFVVGDDHDGLVKAIREVFSEAAWQRCYVHFPRKADDDCLRELRWLYDRRDIDEARADLAAWLARRQAKYPRLTDWVEDHIEQTWTFYLLPPAAAAPQAPQEHQHARAPQRGDPAPHPGRAHLPQPGQPPATRARARGRDPRGLARGQPLSQHGLPQGTQKGAAARSRMINRTPATPLLHNLTHTTYGWRRPITDVSTELGFRRYRRWYAMTDRRIAITSLSSQLCAKTEADC